MMTRPFSVLLAAALILAGSACAAELSEEAQAQEEEAAEAALGENAVSGYTGTGKVILGAVNPDVPAVVGLFRTEKGGVLQLKLKEPGLQELLTLYNGKTATLTGSLRNGGKYLVVQGVVELEPPPVKRMKKGGF